MSRELCKSFETNQINATYQELSKIEDWMNNWTYIVSKEFVVYEIRNAGKDDLINDIKDGFLEETLFHSIMFYQYKVTEAGKNYFRFRYML